MKNAGQGLLATGIALGIGGVYSGHMLSIVLMAIFIFLGTMFYTASKMEDEEESN